MYEYKHQLTFALENISQLRTLNLTFFEADQEVYEKLLASCRFLQKITLDGLVLKNNVINTICLQNGKTLKAIKGRVVALRLSVF